MLVKNVIFHFFTISTISHISTSPLHNQTTFSVSASVSRKSEIMDLILRNSANVNINAVDLYGNTALFYAVRADALENVRLLLETCPDLDIHYQNADKCNALWFACKYNRPTIAKLFLASSLKPTEFEFNVAVVNNHVQVVKELVGDTSAMNVAKALDKSTRMNLVEVSLVLLRRGWIEILKLWLLLDG